MTVPIPPSTANVNQSHLNFPPVYFLDFEVYQHGQVKIPSTMPISPYSKIQIERARLIADRYFALAHPWMTIVSKKQFYNQITNPLAPPQADTGLLLSCLELITWSPAQPLDRKPKTGAYVAAKRSILEAELAGVFSVRLIQAMLLVAIYELGHAIYPATYMTIGNCARLGLALGIDPQGVAKAQNVNPTLLEQEEKRRAWWAILILDRFVFIYPLVQREDFELLLVFDLQTAAFPISLLYNPSSSHFHD